MTASVMTTIKVSKELRERISREAVRAGVTAGVLLAELLDEHERELRFREVRRAYAAADPTYAEETAEWDATNGDDLDR